MITSFKRTVCEIRFETFTEACKYSVANREASSAATQAAGSGYRQRDNWSGTRTFDECVEQSRKGYPQGRKLINKFKAVLDGKLESAHYGRQETYYDVVGTGGFDMGTVLTGVPECAIEWQDTEVMDKRQSNSGKIIKFLVNLTASAMVDSKVLATRGAVVGALVDCLEHEGYRVEVESVVTCTSDGGYFDIRCPIKSAGEHLQLDQLAFALVQPAFFRRFSFVHIAKCGPIGAKAAEWSYGYPRDVEPDQLTSEQVDLYFPRAYGTEPQWNDEKAAIAWIQDQLKLFGINVSETRR